MRSAPVFVLCVEPDRSPANYLADRLYRDKGLRVCGVCPSILRLANDIDATHPDVILLPHECRGHTTLVVVSELAYGCGGPPVVLRSHCEEPREVLKAALCGARGYVLNDDPAYEVAEVLRLVARGEVVFSSRVCLALSTARRR